MTEFPEAFGARLRKALDVRGPLCVGVDPHASLLGAWSLPDSVSGLERFALTVVEALAERVAVLKPQSSFFERFGSGGIAVLERTIAEARARGALVLLDAKRGDIGSTVEAYADAYLDPSSPLFADAVTVSPYLGFGSLEPFFARAERNGCGVFVLAFTSNPEGASVQRAAGADGETVGAAILRQAAARNGDAVPMGPDRGGGGRDGRAGPVRPRRAQRRRAGAGDGRAGRHAGAAARGVRRCPGQRAALDLARGAAQRSGRAGAAPRRPAGGARVPGRVGIPAGRRLSRNAPRRAARSSAASTRRLARSGSPPEEAAELEAPYTPHEAVGIRAGGRAGRPGRTNGDGGAAGPA